MASLAALLPGALVAQAPPGDGPGVVAYVGGREALYRALSGLERAPRRTDYSDYALYRADYTRWRSAQRRAQRADPAGREGKQRRSSTRFTMTPEQSLRVRAAATDRRARLFRRSGGRARMRCRYQVSQTVQSGTVPSGGPGALLGSAVMREVLDAVHAGDDESAAAIFEPAFWEAYELPAARLVDVTWVRVWPPGDPEPGTT